MNGTCTTSTGSLARAGRPRARGRRAGRGPSGCRSRRAPPSRASVSGRTLSARTIAPYLVSPPSRVGWPPRSRTLRQPSQASSRSCSATSGGGYGELRAAKGRRGRAVDADVDQLSRLGAPGEDDGGVAARPAAKERRRRSGSGPRRAPPRRRPTRSRLRRSATRWTASISRSIRSRLTSSGTWSGIAGRLRSLPRRVDERERAVVADLLDGAERLLEVAPRSRRGSRRSGRW